MKFLILTILILSHHFARATSSDYCQRKPIDEIRKVKIESKASYFFRVFPESEKVSFASEKINYILDLNTKKLSKLPGVYDPVPLGETVMSVPNKSSGMAYYSISEVLNGRTEPDILFRSGNMKGVYQSTGHIEKGDGFDIYGIIAAGANDIQFQKIKVSYQPSLKVEPATEVLSLCQGSDIKMPMLSKTGQEISGFDVTAGVSKVWRIDSEKNSCVEVDNLGMFAAKADFSFDSKKLAFHLSANGFSYKLKTDGSGEVDWIERPSSEMSQSVFQYNRETKTLTKVSFNPPGSNAYYPVYRKDGSILYALAEESGDFSFELITPAQIDSGRLAKINYGDVYKMLPVFIIGKLWNFACTPETEINTPEALTLAMMGLDRKSCLNLVKEKWNRRQQLKIIKSDIVAKPGSTIIVRKDLMSLMETRDLIHACDDLDR